MAEKEVGERTKREVKREKKKETRRKKDGLTASVQVEVGSWGGELGELCVLCY